LAASVTVTLASVMFAGIDLGIEVTFAGRPANVNATSPLKPAVRITVTVIVVILPGAVAASSNFAASVNGARSSTAIATPESVGRGGSGRPARLRLTAARTLAVDTTSFPLIDALP